MRLSPPILVSSGRALAAGAAALLVACGGGDGADAGRETAQAAGDLLMTHADATRLAHQASFGPTYPLVTELRRKGAPAWIAEQFALPSSSRYVRGGNDDIHEGSSGNSEFCAQAGHGGANCWRDYYSNTPLVWDFYRNAVEGPDQLRQRVAYALQQILVVSNTTIESTYGLRNYHNNLLSLAFGNYGDILRKVTLSPVMGDYLNHVNNDRVAPNENYARELLQLFSIGTCRLELDGSLRGGSCQPTYDNNLVREYAFALTGWTYPAGGSTPWGCWPQGAHCRYHRGDMVAVPSLHDQAERRLLGAAVVPAGSTPGEALTRVVNSLMAHPNAAPFVAKQLIQHLVTSNPSPAYVQRVATAFRDGRFQTFGAGRRGDMQATIASILLDTEARSTPTATGGRLREPALLFTATLRALNGRTDGDALGWWWGETLRQHLFRPPSVFNFYPADYPVPGTPLVGPQFGIHNAGSAIDRMNFVTYLVWWGGSGAESDVPDALGTRVNLQPFDSYAADPAALVDRMSNLAIGGRLPAAARSAVITAVQAYSPGVDPENWVRNRVRQAAFLIYSSPNFQIQR
ncbi:MAG TPA: DUF1800 domain-containing protein [Methylibium sp.]|nr:DUF1800 domain-containing protein [Methylibium sp.]